MINFKIYLPVPKATQANSTLALRVKKKQNIYWKPSIVNLNVRILVVIFSIRCKRQRKKILRARQVHKLSPDQTVHDSR